MLPPLPPLSTSSTGERALRAHYTAALASLPFPHQERLVITDSYGAVHVTMAGHPAAAPLLLWPAAALPGPLLLAAFAPLASRFRIIAPDFPCQREPGPRPHVWPSARALGHVAAAGLRVHLQPCTACELPLAAWHARHSTTPSLLCSARFRAVQPAAAASQLRWTPGAMGTAGGAQK